MTLPTPQPTPPPAEPVAACRRLTSERPGALHCLVAMAQGYTSGLFDCCPVCRPAVMAAIDGVYGSPLDWHEAYRRSA